MPEICPKSANNPHLPATSKTQRRSRKPVGPGCAPNGCHIRRHLFQQLTAIQINTAGLSGPYHTEEETMEHVVGNHQAVRELRRLLRRSLLIPRKGQVWELLLAASLNACNWDIHKAARLLGASVKQLRSSTREAKAS